MGGYEIMDMAVANNAALASVFWPDAPLGQIAPGAYADLILVDYHAFTELSAGNLPWHILFGFEADAVTSTMVAGQWLMRNRALTTLDEKAIAAEAREISAQTWKRYAELS
jgi:cytosine/adenosine deaminase-related metal-dependent hydrolase